MTTKVKNSNIHSLKLHLCCQKKKNCDDNCCQKAKELLKNGSILSIKQIATQILVLHEFEFDSSLLKNKDCLLAYLQVEDITKVFIFLENQDMDGLTSFTVQELDLILNRLKKSFAKNPALFLPENVFEKLWSSLFYTEVDTWKNWRKLLTNLLDLKRENERFSDDFYIKYFKRIHPSLPWMLKMKYQALTVFIPRVPEIILFESFQDISEQLTSAITTQELSLITGDLIQAYCLKFQGFWEKNHEFHQLFEYLVWMIFNPDFVIRSRTRTLWIPRLLACHEMKLYFLFIYQFCRDAEEFDNCINLFVDEHHYQFTKQERRIYALFLTNKLIGENFDKNLFEISCDFALFAKNSEILCLALSFLKKFINQFNEKLITKVILINFDSDIPEITENLLEIMKIAKFSDDIYELFFVWLESKDFLFHSRQKFIISAMKFFPETFFQNKERIFNFLENICASKKFGIKDLNQILKNLIPIFDEELKEFWMKNCLEKRKNDLENFELFQEFYNYFGCDENYFNGKQGFQKYFPNYDDVKKLIASNETILKKFGSQKLGESISVTTVVRKFTVELESEENCQDSKNIKLDSTAVFREKSEFVEPLILNCNFLTKIKTSNYFATKLAVKNIIEVILRVKNKKIIDCVADFLLQFLKKVKKESEKNFYEIWKENYEILLQFYKNDENYDCRSLAIWRILLAFLEIIPEKLDEIFEELLKIWMNTKNEILQMRTGKTIKALILSSKFNTKKYFGRILKFTVFNTDKSFSIYSNMGHITASICSRIFPQEPTLTCVTQFSKKYPELFDEIVNLLSENPYHRGNLQIIGFLQKLMIIPGIKHEKKLQNQIMKIIDELKKLIFDKNKHLRFAVLQCLSQFLPGFEFRNGIYLKIKIGKELEKFYERLKANGPVKLVKSKVEHDENLEKLQNFGNFSKESEEIGGFLGSCEIDLNSKQILSLILDAAFSISTKKRIETANFVLKSKNMKKRAKLVGLIAFCNDEIIDVLHTFKQNGELMKPIIILMNFIEENQITSKEIEKSGKLLEKLCLDFVKKEKFRFDVNQGADGTLVDRLLVLKTYC